MRSRVRGSYRSPAGRVALLLGATGAALALAACSSASGGAYGGGGGGTHPRSAGRSLSTASTSGAGAVVVDARSRTVYVLLDARRHDLACTSSSGCAGLWPAVRVPSSMSKPHSGSGAHAALVGASSGQATYDGWKVYEYSGDSAAGQANGVGIVSFGGTWFALRADGSLVATNTASGGDSGW